MCYNGWVSDRTDSDYYDPDDPYWWVASEPTPAYDPAKEVEGGSAWCNRCHRLITAVSTPEGAIAPYWRGTGRYDRYLTTGERVVCWDCITTHIRWTSRYTWWVLVTELLITVAFTRENDHERGPDREHTTD